jgi:mannosyltransferase
MLHRSNRDKNVATASIGVNDSLSIMATMISPRSISTDSPDPHSATGKPLASFAIHATLLALVTLLAAFLRMHALTAKSFWLDEGISVDIARLPWPRFLHAIWSGEANMVLYYLVLRFWLTFGSSEAFVRGLSVLFSVATVPAVYFLGARLFGRRVGLLAALLLAINAYHIRYAQETRSYAMVVFFAVLATWLLAKNLQEPSSAHWGIYAAVCAMATYSHFYAVLIVPAHAISLLSWRRDEFPWRKLVGSFLAFVVMVAPIAIFIFAIYVLKTGTPPKLWFNPLQPDSLVLLGVDFSGVYGRLLLSLEMLAIGMAALGAARVRRSGGDSGEAWGYTLLFSWLVAPVVMVVTVSLVKPLFVPRFLIFCLPALLLVVAVGISRLRPAVLSWALFVAISVCSILADSLYYQYDFEMRRQDWRAVTSYVFDRAQPGDSIFFCEPAGEAPFGFYSQLQKSASLRPKTLHANWLEIESDLNPLDPKLAGLVAVPGTNLRASPPVGSRVWLVLMFLDGGWEEEDKGKAVAKWLSNGRQQVDAQDFYPLKVVLYDRNAGGSLPSSDRASGNR